MRIASFNVENLDTDEDDKNPMLALRVPVLRGAFVRLDADLLCLQEVHGQELADHTGDRPSRALIALDTVLAGTPAAGFHRACTLTSGVPYNERNLVVLSRYPIVSASQYRNHFIDHLLYRKVTAIPAETDARDVRWERPILHVQVDHPHFGLIHVINLHLKSRLSSNIEGQRAGYAWHSAAGWAEGYFLSSMKRVGQALETRMLIDHLFDLEPEARILVCGDFNSEPGEVPVEAICGRVENTGNPALRERVLISCSRSVAASIRFSHLHEGHGNLLDHLLMSQAMLPYLHRVQIHNEDLHDESLPFTSDRKYPESDHAPFLAEFTEPA
ncbi:endonuclease [Nitrogeniibacter mangrovi]|uniref:Endonuclease n=1 Tax=Nitrogeniibacter mangrovi TaxID=2016596 RepID=A0A6C1B629_9RHOO|nr:endonuclease/exonuclease/phosphatase family protein [Nitrogeniibacter mangrovi]QID18255.1 endonuclease [Nitrogeniibacter mangrovi]